MAEIRLLLERFESTRLVVVGDAILDRWTAGVAHRLSREAPVPVVDVTADEIAAGGAANAAANVAALGAGVAFVSRVGTDSAGEELRGLLRRRGVDDARVFTDVNLQTPTKQRLVCDGQVLARYDRGHPSSPPPDCRRRLAASLEDALRDADGVLVCDYGYRTLGPEILAVLRRLRRERDVPVVVDAHDLRPFARCAPSAVLPSFAEAMRLVGQRQPQVHTVRAELADEHSSALLERSHAAMAVVTLDSEGAALYRHGHRPYRTYATPVPAGHATGAGDTFAATFTVALAAAADPTQALDLAQGASSVVVRRIGTEVCTRHDLHRHLSRHGGPYVTAERLAARVDADRAHGRRIVFTNGCFDVLHRGHVHHLQQARALGDVLVVALNSDGSVARLKGPGRPVNPVEDRAAVLGALGCVDYVTVFDDDTPGRLLELVRPDIYVKGGDYTREMLPETPIVEQLGGQIRILDYVEDRSTTALLDRIRGSDPGS